MASAACPKAGTCAAQEGTQHLRTSQGHFHGARPLLSCSGLAASSGAALCAAG